MDLVDYQSEVYEKILDDYHVFAKQLEFQSITPIPLSALKGENIIGRSSSMSWYNGPTLLGFLETVQINQKPSHQHFRLPVQYVNRPNLDFRGFSGTVEKGSISVGQEVQVLPSAEKAKVKGIHLFKDNLEIAQTGQAVTLTLDREIDASRGDVIVSADNPPEVSDQFQVTMIWMDKETSYEGRTYSIKIGTTECN